MQTLFSSVFVRATGGKAVPLQLMHIGRKVANEGVSVMHLCQYAVKSYGNIPTQPDSIACATVGNVTGWLGTLQLSNLYYCYLYAYINMVESGIYSHRSIRELLT